MLLGKISKQYKWPIYPYSFWEDMELRLIRIKNILKDRYRNNTPEILLL